MARPFGSRTTFTKEYEKELMERCERVGFEYIGSHIYGRHRYVSFICRKHRYKGIQSIEQCNLKKIRPDNCGCHLRSYTDKDFQHDIQNLPVSTFVSYIDNNTKIPCQCKLCGSIWMVNPNKLKGGRECPHCVSLRRKICKSLKDSHFFAQNRNEMNIDFSFDISKYNLSLVGDYKGAKNPVSIKCNVCGNISYGIAEKFRQGELGCRYCRGSYGERQILHWLSEHNVDFIPQHMFSDCIDKSPLRFDFYLPQKNICIEFQGQQHYYPVNFRGKHYKDSISDFWKLQIRDNIKRLYCLEHNIILIEIPYWEQDNIPIILEPVLSNVY